MAERKLVAICHGPPWWGDPTVDPSGRPVRLEDPVIRRARADAAGAERAGIVRKLVDLPAGCLIVHTASRGAGELFGQAASGLALPVLVAPAWPMEDGQVPRDELLVDLAVGLDSVDWLVKGIVAQPESQPYEGVTPAVGDSIVFGIAMAEAGFAVGSAYPWTEPPPAEPDADEAPADTPADG